MPLLRPRINHLNDDSMTEMMTLRIGLQGVMLSAIESLSYPHWMLVGFWIRYTKLVVADLVMDWSHGNIMLRAR